MRDQVERRTGAKVEQHLLDGCYLRAASGRQRNRQRDLRTYRGLSQIAVRGLKKAQCVSLWSVLPTTSCTRKCPARLSPGSRLRTAPPRFSEEAVSQTPPAQPSSPTTPTSHTRKTIKSHALRMTAPLLYELKTHRTRSKGDCSERTTKIDDAARIHAHGYSSRYGYVGEADEGTDRGERS
jgi:hypothetical protein